MTQGQLIFFKKREKARGGGENESMCVPLWGGLLALQADKQYLHVMLLGIT